MYASIAIYRITNISIDKQDINSFNVNQKKIYSVFN